MLIDNAMRMSEVSASVWDSVLDCLRASISPASVEMWFGNRNLEFDRVEAGVAHLVATNALVSSWISGHFKEPLLAAFRKVLGDVSDFRISVSAESKASPVPILSSEISKVPEPLQAPRISGASLGCEISRKEKILLAENAAQLAAFYSTYSFDTFVEGDSNKIALAICRSVAEDPAECSMNPFFLFGGPGVGKTHLLQSIGRYAITYSTAARTVFRTSEQFLKDFMRTQVSASREDRAEASLEMQRTYEEPQLLLIDDIQFIAGKGHGATEKALFNVLQKRVTAKRMTVFCSDRRPADIPNLYEGFIRYDSNSVAVNVPDFQTRLNILRRKADSLQIPIAEQDRIFHWVATHQRGNVREIEGVVTKLLACHELLGIDLTLETFKSLCESSNVMSPSEPSDKPLPTIAAIKEVVALAYRTSVESLRANSRVKSISLPRKVAMYLCRELTSESLANIGFHFGRDYSTVIANIKSVEREMRRDAEFAEKVGEIRSAFAI